MPIHHLQPSFSGGEISPSLHGRADSSAYGSWLKTARNFYVHPQGGASNRPGTLFMGEAKYEAKECRIIPFVLGEEESYVLELGDKYMRVYSSAGRIASTQGDPYEIATPYSSAEVRYLNYTQYDQKLFLTHPKYPPKQLVRVESGSFEFTDVSIKYGPFMLANTNETKHLRAVQYQDTQVSEGVSATLSFQPILYPNWAVYATFDDIIFFAGSDFGLDVAAMVAAFNNTFGPQGYRGYNYGGLVKIESPRDTGGSCNGKQLIIYYLEGFTVPPAVIFTQTLSGGSNKGEIIAQGENKYLLESDFDCFKPGHVGGCFSLTHRLPSQLQTGTLGYEDVSTFIKSGGDWKLRTTGQWNGKLALDVSTDMGQTWEEVKIFSRETADDNLNTFGQLEDTAEMYCVRLRACQISGEAGYELQSDSFVQEGVLRVSDFVNERKLAVKVERSFGAQDWTADWAEGSFSPAAGYPSCVFFYQDRLGLAGTQAEAQTVWFSKTGEYDNFGHARNTLEDSDSISVNLSGKKLNAIHSVAVSNKLLVFTAGSEWTISSSGALTPYNIQIQQQSERGASRTAPLMVGNKALYVQARGGVLRDFYYDYNSASYTSNDLTLYAKHIFFNREIREVCYQQEPDNLIWCVLDNGTLAVLTYLAEQNVCAWTRHDTQGNYKSICTIPNRGYDEIWFAVERNGRCFIERLAQRLASKEPEDQLFLDAAVSRKSETAFSELGGLEHLEGCEVGVLADGSPLAGLVVEDGKITLPRPMKCVHAGLAYEAELQTLPAVLEQANGTMQDRRRRLVSVTVKMLDSRGGKVGTDPNQLDEIIQRGTENFNTPITLKTQDYVLSLSGAHSLVPSVIFKQTEPLPVTLLAFISRIV